MFHSKAHYFHRDLLDNEELCQLLGSGFAEPFFALGFHCGFNSNSPDVCLTKICQTRYLRFSPKVAKIRQNPPTASLTKIHRNTTKCINLSHITYIRAPVCKTFCISGKNESLKGDHRYHGFTG
jgi:hypothetical protein